jgi:hypothetical protein
MKKINKILFSSLLLFFSSYSIVHAHPGKTAADGCHYCRTNCAKWGEVEGARHCHDGGNSESNNPSGLTDKEEQEILDYLNSPKGKTKGNDVMDEFLKSRVSPRPTSLKSNESIDKSQEDLFRNNILFSWLAVGGLGFGVFQWLKNKGN